jgi:hypothetical protein
MSTPVALNAIAADIVGHYSHAAKSLVAACQTASKRALAASGTRYARFVEHARLPVVGDQPKARLIAAERRVAGVVGEGVVRAAAGYDRVIELISGRALKGLEAFAQRTEWAKDMFVVDTVRRINLPAAKVSLRLASRIDDAAVALSARAKGTNKKIVATSAVKNARAARRVRRAA